MKRLINILAVALSILIFNGCHKDLNTQINALKEQVAALETMVSEMNSNINSVQTVISALENNDHIESINPIYKDGKIAGYSISFTSGSVIDLYNGTDGTVPVIGIQQNLSTGYYYWTIKMGSGEPTWMTNSYGLKVRATGTIPQMKIEDGYWWVSYDEGISWVKLYLSTGTEGTTVFKDIDYSDPYYVRFTLYDGTYFKIPTMKGISELTAMCDTINTNISAFKTIINNVDTSVFIKSTAEIVENDAIAGYRITLNNGQVLDIRNGKDNSENVYLGIRQDSDNLNNYWTIQFGKTGSVNWLMSNGGRLSAQPQDGTPVIGVADTLGSYYFTVQYGTNSVELMKNDAGEYIQATGRYHVRFFEDIFVNNFYVTLTMVDGTEISLERTRQAIPSIVLAAPREDIALAPVMTLNASGIYEPGIFANKTYTFDAVIRDTVYSVTSPYPTYPIYKSGTGINVNAIGLDDSVVTGVEAATFTAFPITVNSQNIYRYEIALKVTFKTGSTIDPARTTRIAVFMTWNNRSVMKVIEFKNN